MEIPVVNRIGDFEAGINSLQNSSFLSQIFALIGVEKIHSFCKWGALFLAIVASISAIINRIKFLVIQIQNHHLIPSSPAISTQQDYNNDSKTDASCSSESENVDEEDDDKRSSSSNWISIDEDFGVKGSGHDFDDQWQNRSLRRRINKWSDFTSGKNVVKLWDNLGLGLGLNVENESTNCVSIYDVNKDLDVFSIFGQNCKIPAFSTSSSAPVVVVSAETNTSGHLLRLWDTRVGGRLPEILVEWKPKIGKYIGISGGGIEKVYVGDDVTGRLTTVGDLRKVSLPLVNATESKGDTWWDADAVSIAADESVDECG